VNEKASTRKKTGKGLKFHTILTELPLSGGQKHEREVVWEKERKLTRKQTNVTDGACKCWSMDVKGGNLSNTRTGLLI